MYRLNHLAHELFTQPEQTLGVIAALNIVAFFLYGFDKYQAIKQGSRVPERVLLALALAGAWPGSWIAQRKFRHKTQKMPFQLYFRLLIMVNIALLTAIFITSR